MFISFHELLWFVLRYMTKTTLKKTTGSDHSFLFNIVVVHFLVFDTQTWPLSKKWHKDKIYTVNDHKHNCHLYTSSDDDSIDLTCLEQQIKMIFRRLCQTCSHYSLLEFKFLRHSRCVKPEIKFSQQKSSSIETIFFITRAMKVFFYGLIMWVLTYFVYYMIVAS